MIGFEQDGIWVFFGVNLLLTAAGTSMGIVTGVISPTPEAGIAFATTLYLAFS